MKFNKTYLVIKVIPGFYFNFNSIDNNELCNLFLDEKMAVGLNRYTSLYKNKYQTAKLTSKNLKLYTDRFLYRMDPQGECNILV
jgi:hypothetical protein